MVFPAPPGGSGPFPQSCRSGRCRRILWTALLQTVEKRRAEAGAGAKNGASSERGSFERAKQAAKLSKTSGLDCFPLDGMED